MLLSYEKFIAYQPENHCIKNLIRVKQFTDRELSLRELSMFYYSVRLGDIYIYIYIPAKLEEFLEYTVFYLIHIISF